VLMTTSADICGKLIDLLRRDLFGPHPERDPELEREVLSDKPSRFYVGGFIVPAFDGTTSTAADEDEESKRIADDLLAAETLDSPIDAKDDEIDADAQETPDQPPKDRFLPPSIGLTVMLPEAVRSIELLVTWGDYRAEPPLPAILVLPEAAETGEKNRTGRKASAGYARQARPR
jgi:hypothetical protein